MLFFFKKPNIVVDCFTDNPKAFEFAKPDHAIKFIPDWWKNIPVSYVPKDSFFKHPTLKGCDGIKNNFKHGIVIPMWCDFAIEISPKGIDYFRYQFGDHASQVSSHPYKQFNNYIKEEEILHVKFHSPWYLSCKKNIYWAWTDPKWNTIKVNDYVVLPGITSFKYQRSTNINVLFYKGEKTKIIEIKYNTPLMHIIPLSDKKLILKHHLVDETEINKISLDGSNIKFTNSVNVLKNFRMGKK
jgi:hypothetical protein